MGSPPALASSGDMAQPSRAVTFAAPSAEALKDAGEVIVTSWGGAFISTGSFEDSRTVSIDSAYRLYREPLITRTEFGCSF